MPLKHRGACPQGAPGKTERFKEETTMAFVTLEQKGPVAVITMNRPEALNALNDQVLRDLDAVLDQVEENEDILTVVLTGAGRSFVAGADIGQMSQLTAAQAKAFGVLGNRVFLKLFCIGTDKLHPSTIVRKIQRRKYPAYLGRKLPAGNGRSTKKIM